ncbi:hypothetical protein ABPG74_014375 [Tetrahymena malaccensis]
MKKNIYKAEINLEQNNFEFPVNIYQKIQDRFIIDISINITIENNILNCNSNNKFYSFLGLLQEMMQLFDEAAPIYIDFQETTFLPNFIKSLIQIQRLNNYDNTKTFALQLDQNTQIVDSTKIKNLIDKFVYKAGICICLTIDTQNFNIQKNEFIATYDSLNEVQVLDFSDSDLDTVSSINFIESINEIISQDVQLLISVKKQFFINIYKMLIQIQSYGDINYFICDNKNADMIIDLPFQNNAAHLKKLLTQIKIYFLHTIAFKKGISNFLMTNPILTLYDLVSEDS